jgi:hypothetical protein
MGMYVIAAQRLDCSRMMEALGQDGEVSDQQIRFAPEVERDNADDANEGGWAMNQVVENGPEDLRREQEWAVICAAPKCGSIDSGRFQREHADIPPAREQLIDLTNDERGVLSEQRDHVRDAAVAATGVLGVM